MAELSVNVLGLAAVNLTTGDVAAAAGGDTFPNDGKTFFYIDNQDTTEHTVTFTGQRGSASVPGFGTLTAGDAAVTVPPATQMAIGPFPVTRFNNGAGQVQAEYDAVTAVTVAAVRVPNPDQA